MAAVTKQQLDCQNITVLLANDMISCSAGFSFNPYNASQ